MKKRPTQKQDGGRTSVGRTYDPSEIEKKWQKKWAASKIYRSQEARSSKLEASKSKFYVLDMFPYPSGEGLHVGHPKGYIATDVVSRMKRMQGHSVLHPIGFDAFGLPAENYAIKMKKNPMDLTDLNVKRFKDQLELLGFDYDWSREINTTDPDYYRWTQWIFLQLFKKGLAYESFEPINWCPSCKTGLANEDVENGRCERCGTPVEKKPMRQWVLKITDYAERLLTDLDATDYVMPKLVDKSNPHQPGKPLVKRVVAHAIVFDPKTKKYLIIRNKKFGWDTIIIGGIEAGETAVETARREVREETGYTDLEFKRLLGGLTEVQHYAKHKGENRIAIAQAVYFELKSGARVPIGADEDKDDEVLWIDEKDFVPGKMVNSELPIWLERINDSDAGWPKPLLDWPEAIKESQRNWIGRSEGALIKFKVQSAKCKIESQIEVFTTRPDTLFGVTYVVLAPEHKSVGELLKCVENRKEVEDYINRSKLETDIERTDTSKDKTGVELKGVKAMNPANNEEVPVWIADYVLADYGTGAVMAVPAHDERDWEFAKKFGLRIKEVIAPLVMRTGDKDAWRTDEKEVVRPVVVCIIKHWSENKYLFLKKKLVDKAVVAVAGGIDGEDIITAGQREIREETGYLNAKFVRDLGTQVFYRFYSVVKNQNRISELKPLYFELVNSDREEMTEEEKGYHDTIWLSEDQIETYFAGRPFNRIFWDQFKGIEKAFIDDGILINSGGFNGKESGLIKKEITASVGGKWVTKFKLRDWVFSRQRYWGEPIPLIHCEKCGVVPVPEKDLPVKLPKVKSYEPTGTGESPLAAIEKWVNVKCPKCRGNAKRETNTMPQWAGSSWYYIAYCVSENLKSQIPISKQISNPKFKKKTDHWLPVDLYVGGAEHATRHLIYSRFWHKFLYDIGVISTIEPFIKLQSVGLIMGEDGRKMSKRFGNVVNPDDIVNQFGADTLRIYEMFMGPFDQQIAWSTKSMAGPRRFIERVWKLADRVTEEAASRGPASRPAGRAPASRPPSRPPNAPLEALPSVTLRILHKTIKKVTENIQSLRFNTAISSLMIAANELEKAAAAGTLDRGAFESYLKLLAPFAPHVTEELWAQLGNKKSVHISEWPKYDPALIVNDRVTIALQINGKTRGSFAAMAGASKEELEKMAREAPEAKKWLEGKEIKRVVTVPDRLVNIVAI